ncbi:acyl-CoA thioesterase [Paracoccus suum]|uniref:Acyl-CoA thioesterase n=2 Tax=Paracoccus suum TaxID=2259340 RepID=A0A344PNW1_9RHOB|nr:acyl-CoA thioesterase [Paracoccus suum]
MILPEQTNHYGTLFGGEGLSLLAKTAFVTASRYARADVVMAGAEGVRFIAPVPPGALLEMTGTVTRQGRSSLTVRVEGTAETPQTGARQPVMQADFEMVAVDGSGRPTPI